MPRDVLSLDSRSDISQGYFKRRGPSMPAILDFLFHEYCRARLAEMRKQLFLVRSVSDEVLEANCDAGHPDSSDDRSSLTDGPNKADLIKPN